MQSSDTVNSQTDPVSSSIPADEKLTKVARRIVRFVLSTATSDKTILSREKLVKCIHEVSKEEGVSRVQFPKVYPIVNELLFDILGYELRGISPKLTRPTDTVPTSSNDQASRQQANRENSYGSRATHFILLNKLPYMPHFSSFKIAQASKTYQDEIVDSQYIGDDMDVASQNTITSKLNVDQDMVMKGLLSVILLTILFSKNNILHSELLDTLETMGVPVDGTDIPILGINIDALLKILERREYIIKFEEQGESETAIALYKIGRRTKHEFDLDSLTLMTRELMGLSDEQSVSLRDDIRKVLGDAY